MVLDDIIYGFEKNLELERELGVKVFELDRTLLNPLAELSTATVQTKIETAKIETEEKLSEIKSAASSVRREIPSHEPLKEPCRSKEIVYDFIFVHDKPLSQEADGMMDKAIAALGSTREKSPVISAGAVPMSKMYVFLGMQAAKRFMPLASFSLGSVLTSAGGKKFVVTHSPEQVIRFSNIEKVQMRMKKELWSHINIAVKAVNSNKK